ncbi:LysR family transcriptional regulator [uncultured Cohaesibacter sp.]|uniref:LysR family transcriptional regulator n=1 Tax=uncultured Cohaesibacter sp. TaxID=1002546 RepID=UPI0029C738A2|nr:LysR family transcriptional regulator [uncultured Cohaesibacter sp.]
MEFRHLEAFVSAAERESFTRAADHMHLTQSAVSQLIRKLEEEVGEPLFVRDGRAVKLTEAGFNLFDTAVEILMLRRKLEEKTVPLPAAVNGSLRIGTSSSATAYLWASMYQAFADTYPNVDLDVRTTLHTVTTVDQILSGELDIGFLPFPLSDPRLEGYHLANHEALLVSHPAHPLAKKQQISKRDLQNERFILFKDGMNFRAVSDYFFRTMGFEPQVVLQSNDTNLIRAMVQVGFGIAFLPDWGLQRELKEGQLVRLPVQDMELYEEIGLAYLRRGICLAAAEFMKFAGANRHLIPDIALKDLPQNWKHFSLR